MSGRDAEPGAPRPAGAEGEHGGPQQVGDREEDESGARRSGSVIGGGGVFGGSGGRGAGDGGGDGGDGGGRDGGRNSAGGGGDDLRDDGGGGGVFGGGGGRGAGDGGGGRDGGRNSAGGSGDDLRDDGGGGDSGDGLGNGGGDTAGRGGFARNVRTVSGLTLASRVTGLARDAALARVLGAGPVADAFLFAFMVPNLFRRLFGEGALAAAFLPVYARLTDRHPEAGRRLGRRVIGTMVVALSLLVLLAELALLLGELLGEGVLAGRLAMVLLPYAPMVCAVAILGAMLQVRGRFGPTAAAPLLLNGVMIAALVLPARRLAEDPSRHAGLLALGVVLAGVLQVLWALAALRASERPDGDAAAGTDRRGDPAGTDHVDPAPGDAAGTGDLDPEPVDADRPGTSATADPDLLARRGARDVLRHAIPMMIGLGALQLGTLIDGLIASWPSVVGPTVLGIDYPLAPGAMTTITLSQRLYQFPLGVFGIAIATAIFPLLARRAAAGDPAGVRTTVRDGLRLVALIALPASLGLVLVREPLIATLFEGGDFTAADTARAAPVVAAYGAGVWAYSAVHVLARAFYALERPRTPVRIALIAVFVGLVLNLVLIWTPLREAGLAVATAVGSALQVVLLLRALGPELGRRHGGVPTAPASAGGAHVVDAPTRRAIGRCAGLTAVMGLAVAGLDAVAGVPLDAAVGGWSGAAGRLAVLVGGGALVYGGLAAMLRLPELTSLLGRRPRTSGGSDPAANA